MLCLVTRCVKRRSATIPGFASVMGSRQVFSETAQCGVGNHYGVNRYSCARLQHRSKQGDRVCGGWRLPAKASTKKRRIHKRVDEEDDTSQQPLQFASEHW